MFVVLKFRKNCCFLEAALQIDFKKYFAISNSEIRTHTLSCRVPVKYMYKCQLKKLDLIPSLGPSPPWSFFIEEKVVGLTYLTNELI